MELAHVKREAVSYLRRHFKFAIPKPVEAASIEQLLLLASSSGHRQLCACTILKALGMDCDGLQSERVEPSKFLPHSNHKLQTVAIAPSLGRGRKSK